MHPPTIERFAFRRHTLYDWRHEIDWKHEHTFCLLIFIIQENATSYQLIDDHRVRKISSFFLLVPKEV